MHSFVNDENYLNMQYVENNIQFQMFQIFTKMYLNLNKRDEDLES